MMPITASNSPSASAFADYSIELGQFNLTAGLRYEYQKTDYYESDIYKEEKSPSYHDLIPIVSIFYKKEDWNIGLSYRMMKLNPSYSMLSSTISYQSKYQYHNGNPELEPQKHNAFSLEGGLEMDQCQFILRISNETCTPLMPNPMMMQSTPA